MSTIVLQSWKEWPRAGWRRRCLASARAWAAARGHEWRFIGDELFAPIPPAARAGCRGERLPLTDLGRLLWIAQLHEEGWRRVIWLDADVLVIDPALDLSRDGFAREAWISRAPGGGFRALKGVNNSAMSFAAGSPLLARCLGAALTAAEGFDKRPHPRALGPDLLLRLHRADALPLFDDVAMFSPLVTEGLAGGDLAPFAAHASVWKRPVRAVNLCGSLASDALLNRAVALLAAGLPAAGVARHVETVAEAKIAPPAW